MVAPAEGRTLGRYELVSRVGSGTVQRWLARQQGLDKLVELRIVEGADADAQMERARSAAQLKHGNIADVIDLGESEGLRYVVTEHLDGEPLAAVIDAGRVGKRIDELGLARIIADAADGLDAAHTQGDGLVHRRLTPSTIVVLYNGQVKVVALDATAGGPLSYTAPERLDGGVGDARSDVFSLGAILWEALTAEKLFEPGLRLPPTEIGDGDAATKRLVRHLEIVSPAELNANVPEPLAEICLRALARDPAKRQASAQRLAIELEELLTQASYSRRNDRIATYMGEAFASQIQVKRQRRQTRSSVQPALSRPPASSVAPPVGGAAISVSPPPAASPAPLFQAPAAPAFPTRPDEPTTPDMLSPLANKATMPGLSAVDARPPAATGESPKLDPRATMMGVGGSATAKPATIPPASTGGRPQKSVTIPPVVGKTEAAKPDVAAKPAAAKNDVAASLAALSNPPPKPEAAPSVPAPSPDPWKLPAATATATATATVAATATEAAPAPVAAPAPAAVAPPAAVAAPAAVRTDLPPSLQDPALQNAAANATITGSAIQAKSPGKATLPPPHRNTPNPTKQPIESAPAPAPATVAAPATATAAAPVAAPATAPAPVAVPAPAPAPSPPATPSRPPVDAPLGTGTMLGFASAAQAATAAAAAAGTPALLDSPQTKPPEMPPPIIPPAPLTGPPEMPPPLVPAPPVLPPSAQTMLSPPTGETPKLSSLPPGATGTDPVPHRLPNQSGSSAAIPERPSTEDISAGWAWKSGSVPALGDVAELEEEPPRTNRKPLMYAVGGALAFVVVLLVAVMAFGGGSDDDDAKAKSRRQAEAQPPPAPPAKPTEAPSVTPDAAEAVTPDAAPATPIDPYAGSNTGSGSDAGSGSGSAGSGAGSGSNMVAVTPTPPKPTPPVVAPTPPKPTPPAITPKPPEVKKPPPKPPEIKKPPPPKPPEVKKQPEPPKKPEIKKGDAEGNYKTGIQLLARGDLNGALAALRASVQANPNYAPAWRGLGLVFERMGDKDSARAAYRKYLALAPSAGDAPQIRERMEKL